MNHESLQNSKFTGSTSDLSQIWYGPCGLTRTNTPYLHSRCCWWLKNVPRGGCVPSSISAASHRRPTRQLSNTHSDGPRKSSGASIQRFHHHVHHHHHWNLFLTMVTSVTLHTPHFYRVPFVSVIASSSSTTNRVIVGKTDVNLQKKLKSPWSAR